MISVTERSGKQDSHRVPVIDGGLGRPTTGRPKFVVYTITGIGEGTISMTEAPRSPSLLGLDRVAVV